MPQPKKLHKKTLSFLVGLCFLASLAGLGACAQKRSVVPYSPESQMTRAETCEHACNRERDRCGDVASTRFENYGEPRQIIGVGAICDSGLRSCLDSCRKQ